MQLSLNAKKNLLGVNRKVLLGYVFTEKGRILDPEKSAIIDQLATPINAKVIAKLLDHLGCNWKLILDFARLVIIIIQLLKKNCNFECTKACGRAFEEVKSKLISYPMLTSSIGTNLFHVFCDTSNVAIGSALCQSIGEKFRDQPTVYASKQSTPVEKNYTTTKRACLAIVFSVKLFWHYLMCNPLMFFIDHMTIKYLVNKAKLSGRLAR